MIVRSHVSLVTNAIKQVADYYIQEIVKEVVVLNKGQGSVIIAKRKAICPKSVQNPVSLEKMEMVRREMVKGVAR